MAKRVGKYKLGKHEQTKWLNLEESNVSLTDQQLISGLDQNAKHCTGQNRFYSPSIFQSHSRASRSSSNIFILLARYD